MEGALCMHTWGEFAQCGTEGVELALVSPSPVFTWDSLGSAADPQLPRVPGSGLLLITLGSPVPPTGKSALSVRWDHRKGGAPVPAG
ncbi:hypothetical protein AAFF_G00003240 [Aldrovandia affinis]|uniref:Uncharacterized protein n=1 Tax=Aldrovandia affinis TaxID=143900 RepID=A0AAD7TDF4_9TELE|nr:hypothetical protein AAFF_G00003240 [Aldrovandia affinis]